MLNSKTIFKLFLGLLILNTIHTASIQANRTEKIIKGIGITTASIGICGYLSLAWLIKKAQEDNQRARRQGDNDTQAGEAILFVIGGFILTASTKILAVGALTYLCAKPMAQQINNLF